jgi:photosystem II stability/assembly factor-like uncharacterized protein
MSELLIGTGRGVFRLGNDGNIQPEEGPPTVAFLTRAHEGILVVTQEGALWRRTGGDDWQRVHERPVAEDIWAFSADPRVPGRLYLGVSPALLYWSDDGGANWKACEAIRRIPGYESWTFPPPPHIPHVKHIDLRPDNPDDVLGAVEEGWLIRTTDGGATWTNLTNGSEFDSHTAYFMPGAPEVIISTSGAGVYRSQDDGGSFVPSEQGLDRRYMAHLVVHPERPNVVFTAAAAVPPPGWSRPEGADAAFYRSDDQGLTWRRLLDGVPDHLSAAPRTVVGDPRDPDTVYVGMTDGTVWTTHDGKTFEPAIRLTDQLGTSEPPSVTSLTVVP